MNVARDPQIKTIDDLHGRVVGIRVDNTSDLVARKLLAEGAIGDIKYFPYDGILTALDDLSLFTGDDDQSHFSIGEIEWKETEALNAISFEETAAGARLDWHNAPHRQYVITLSGRLEFESRSGAKQVVELGDILLAEDTSGGGHRWRLVDDQPWRRVYVALP